MDILKFTDEQLKEIREKAEQQKKVFLQRRKIRLQEEVQKIDVAISNIEAKEK